jgi:hypothetical protein
VAQDLKPAKIVSDALFFVQRPGRSYRLKDAEGRLVAVRRTSDGHFLTVRVSVAVPADVDYESPERITERLWWLRAWPGADRAVLERSMAAARSRAR